MSQVKEIFNFIGGSLRKSAATDYLKAPNPATSEVFSKVPLSVSTDVEAAVLAAKEAFITWSQIPATERVKYLFRLRLLLEENSDEICRTITMECGKTLAESRGELRRGIENVEVSTGIPSLMMGYNSEDIARGVDEIMIRQPLGVVAAITPFNFPIMIPLWYLPYAIACGNTFILKPSEKASASASLLFRLIEELELPQGVANLVTGAKEAVDALLDHPDIRAISFVGSTPVAKYVYARATNNGKRAQCQGGAKNPVVVLPDADMAATTRIVSESAFGCAGQRCLAASLGVTVGEARENFIPRIVEAARSRKMGYGLDPGVEMGPVITSQSKDRIQGLIAKAASEGAHLMVDGRNPRVPGYEHGNFVRPTVFDNVAPESELTSTEIFGPVLTLNHVATIEDAIKLVNQSAYGNMACLFTSSGAAARKFRHEVRAGNIGINIGVAAPMAFFPFSGWKESFFGDLHGQGHDAIEFYTDKKVVVERWADTQVE